MAKVSKLKIDLQNNTDNTYFASWEFPMGSSSSSSGGTTSSTTFRAGDVVSIKSSATKYYNGVSIPSWVKELKWKLVQVKGNRAVLGKNASGSESHNIQSAINTKDITKSSSSKVAAKASAKAVDSGTLDHYSVKWYYATGDGVWFDGGSSDVKVRNATYSPPSNATKIKVKVKPVAKKHKVKKNKKTVEVSYWTGKAVTKEYKIWELTPDTPSAPTVSIAKYKDTDKKHVGNYKLTASLTNITDSKTDKVEFWVYSGNKKKYSGIVEVKTARATFTTTVAVGSDYRVKCRAINVIKNPPSGVTINFLTSGIYSEKWSGFSNSVSTAPNTPKWDETPRALSSTSVYLGWKGVSNAKAYTIEYTQKKGYFDSNPSGVSSVNIDATTGWSHAEITGLDTAGTWYFRIKATNDQDSSYWSSIQQCILGKKPGAPTTWSSTTTAITGESVILYWAHNAEDGSTQTSAEVEVTVKLNDSDTGTTTVHVVKNKNLNNEDKKDETLSYKLDTSTYDEGAKVEWRVRTAGATLQLGDWSIKRTIDIYAKPTVTLDMTDSDGTSITELASFPFYISAITGPNTQAPIGYHVSVIANENYETVDNIGNPKYVSAGEAIYSKYFDINEALLAEMSPSNIDLESGNTYTIQCVASMNSGLTATDTYAFSVSWTDEEYEPEAEIGIDEDTYSATIIPKCEDIDGILIDDALLSVYRREFDGTFTEIQTEIENDMGTTVTDPHPALDYARYRIVATSKTTGAVSYNDIPGYPVSCSSVIIQWDEEWSEFNPSNEDELEEPTWTGSMLKLPGNIDVSDSNKKDVSLIEYIGREYPVSYYGTQVGSTSTWNLDIPKDDVDTLYGIRRLARYFGDVYVREPSGTGYWANISVSYSQKHCTVVIPVTISVTRVEGGK